jgi:hypothetical protein
VRAESTGRVDGYVVFSEPAGGSTADDGAWIRQGYLVILCIGNEESVVEQKTKAQLSRVGQTGGIVNRDVEPRLSLLLPENS